MNYILLIIPYLSVPVFWAKDLVRSEYKTIWIVCALVLFFFGIIVQVIKEKERIPNLISNYHEEIDDFRDWKSEEATYRILGNVKRLSKLGETKFDLNRCPLSGIHIKGLRIKNSDLNCIDLSNSYIAECVFDNVNFNGANLASANIVHSSFIKCKIDRANYFDAILFDVDFKVSDLSHFDMTNNLDKARVIYDCKHIHNELLQMIQTQKPELLEKPTSLKMTRFSPHWKVEEK